MFLQLVIIYHQFRKCLLLLAYKSQFLYQDENHQIMFCFLAHFVSKFMLIVFLISTMGMSFKPDYQFYFFGCIWIP